MPFWCVAMTKSNSEGLAKYHLERQGYEVYLPKFLSRIGKEIKIKALFPRYIFVKIESRWYSIMGTRGISRLLLNEEQPAIVPDKIIENLMRREDSKGFIALDEQPKFKPGEKVAIASGPFSGHYALYQGMRDADRARVLINLLGQSTPVELDEKDLAAVAVPQG
jgi:transcriptional antiterminator RfaH